MSVVDWAVVYCLGRLLDLLLVGVDSMFVFVGYRVIVWLCGYIL